MSDIVTAFVEGLITNIAEKPEKHVETVMSDVFIYQDVVRKIYKKRQGVFVDLRDHATRKDFYHDDFSWNQVVSPTIHRSLHNLHHDGTHYHQTPDQEPHTWLIEMKKINTEDTLFYRLRNQTATKTDVQALAKKQTIALHTLTEQYLSHHQDLLDHGLQQLWHDRLDKDLRVFGKSFGATIDPTLTDQRIDALLFFFTDHPFFKTLTAADALIMIDNHAGNVVFVDGKPEFIDIFLPKRSWRVLDRHNAIARIATCVRVLGNDDLADAMYDTYRDFSALAPAEVYAFEEAYNALIKGYYYTYLQQPEVADKYFAFADETIAHLSI